MDAPSRPRAFISYRHVEHETGAAQDALNATHRKWVETFAADLSEWQVEAVYDGHLREIFRPYTSSVSVTAITYRNGKRSSASFRKNGNSRCFTRTPALCSTYRLSAPVSLSA